MNPNIIYILIFVVIIALAVIAIKNKNTSKKLSKVVDTSKTIDEISTNKPCDGVYLNLFNSNVELDASKKVTKEYIEKCVSHFNKLSDSVIEDLCKKLVGYYVFMLEVIKESETYDELEEIKRQMPKSLSGREILKCVKPFTLIIEEPQDENIPAYTLYCDCIWEPEHGAWLIFKGDKILFCGDICEIGPWREEDVYQEQLGLLKDYFNDYNFVTKKLKEHTIEK